MSKRKFMLCKYPTQGFGEKSGKFYLLDMFGNRYDITDEYDKVLEQMDKSVTINGETFCKETISELVETLQVRYDTSIENW